MSRQSASWAFKYLMLLIVIMSLAACGGDSGPSDPAGTTETEPGNVVSSLISVNSATSIVGIVTNKSGAMVFYVDPGASVFQINRVGIITSTGETTFVVRTKAAQSLADGHDRYFTVETSINEVADGVNRSIQDDLESSPLSRVVSGELVRGLKSHLANPESPEDRLNRFATDTALECINNPITCVNSFREAIGSTDDPIEDESSNPSDPPLITSDQVDVVSDAGTRVPTNDLAGFSISPQEFRAPADLTASLVQGTPTSFDGTGLSHSWSYEELPSDGFTPINFGSGISANLSGLQPGSYKIILNVAYSRGGGAVATTSQTIEVLPALVDGPDFTATTLATTVPALYVLSASDPSETATGFAWVSSNGLSAQGKETTMTFPAAGTFTITLTLTYSDGSTAEVSKPVTVTDEGGGGGGEVHPYLQAIFDHHGGSWTSNEVSVYVNGTTYSTGESADYDGVNPIYTYTVNVDPANLTVTYVSAGGSGSVTFPGDLLKYAEANHGDFAGGTLFRIMFDVDGPLSTRYVLGETSESYYFLKTEYTGGLKQYQIIFNKPAP